MQRETARYVYPSYQTHEPCEYFSNGMRSPTFNRKSHDRWAARHVRALDKLHEYAPPTHWATIKFHRPEPIAAIRSFCKSLTRAVGYYNRSRSRHLAMFGIHHIEGDNSVHLHVLVRANGADPLAFLAKVADKFNRKHGTFISVPYCEPADDVISVTHYPFQLGSKDKLLFARNLGMRFTFQCGGYFLDGTKAQHEREQRKDFLLTRLELQAEKVVGNAEDFVTAPPRTQQQPPAPTYYFGLHPAGHCDGLPSQSSSFSPTWPVRTTNSRAPPQGQY